MLTQGKFLVNMPQTEGEVNEKIYDHRIMPDWSSVVNETNGTLHYSKDMIFNDGHRLSITVYSILFVLSTIGNSTVLYLIVKRRWHSRTRSPSRIDIMLMHLAIADLMVTFLLMPLEIAWSYTVQWRSTDFVCRTMSFLRVFGLYLSSFVLVSISIDRYYAILKPLKFSTSRGRFMLMIAWIASVICSSPQAFLFHLEEHPNLRGYFQCVTFHSFPSDMHKLMYQIANISAMYACPLITFIYCYGAIYVKIYRKSKRVIKGDGLARFRRSNDDVLGRAKKRTLKMTITIVIVFVICWTPYYIICVWYWIDGSSAVAVNPLLRKGLFIFACANSCMNPLVYGVFNIRSRQNDNNASVNNRHTSLTSTARIAVRERNGSGRTVVLPVTMAIGESNGVDTTNTTNTTAITSDIFAITKLVQDVEDEKPPKICISCGDSIELANTVQKP